MQKVILDETLRARLGNLRGETELCDEEGNQVAYVLPTETYHRLVYDLARAEVTEEELELAREDYRKNGGVTTAELIGYLHSLGEKRKPGA